MTEVFPVSETFEDVASLVHSGETAQAKRLAAQVLDNADAPELQLIAECARIVQLFPRTANAHMRHLWKRHTGDAARAIIAACAPKQGEAPRHPDPADEPARRPLTRYVPPRDHAPRRVDPRTLPAPRTTGETERQRRAATALREYDDTRAGVEETQPDYRSSASPFDIDRRDGRAESYLIDYDRAALPAPVGWSCLACFCERPRIDGARLGTDDGLCTECRDKGLPGIPQDPAPRSRRAAIIARCRFIVENHTAGARQVLRAEWKRAAPGHDRSVIAVWVAGNLPAQEAPHAPTPTPVEGTPRPEPAPAQKTSTSIETGPSAPSPAVVGCGTCGSARGVRHGLCRDCRTLFADTGEGPEPTDPAPAAACPVPLAAAA